MDALKHQFRHHGRERIIAFALAGFAIVSLALFIAGAIMLGVGISKVNSAADMVKNCSTLSTSLTSTQIPNGGGNGDGGDNKKCPTCPLCPTDQAQPIPYFLTLQMQNVTRTQLEQNYSTTLEQLQQQLQLLLPDASVITVLSITPQLNAAQSSFVAESTEETELDDQTSNESSGAIVSIIYTSSKMPKSVDELKQKIEQSGNSNATNQPVITVSYIQNSQAPQTQTLDNQMCTRINPKPDIVLPPGEKLYPCARRIAFIMDSTDMTPGDIFTKRFEFLANTVLNDKWNHFERVGYGKFSQVIAYHDFGTYPTYDSLKKIINDDANQPVLKNASLIAALRSLNNYYKTDGILRSSVIVFITKALKEDVDRVVRWENKGNSLKMAVTLVTVGPSQGDGARINIDQLNRLGLPIIQWENTNEDIPDWEQKFWKAYTCSNTQSSQMAKRSELKMDAEELLYRSISTRDSKAYARQLLERIEYSQKHRKHAHFSGLAPVKHQNDEVEENPDSEPFSPCEKKIVIVYDVSTAITAGEFKKQLNFLSDKLLANNWNHFERLGLGFYGTAALLNPFKIMGSVDKAKSYIQFTYQSRRNASLSTLLGALALEDMYRQTNGDSDSSSQNISTIVFVSNPSARDIQRAIPYAKQVDSYGRLTFVALKPRKVGPRQLAGLVSSDHVIPWDITNKDEPNNWQMLFQNAYDCPGDAGSNPGLREKQQDFLTNSLFASEWNHFERLGLGNYNKYSSFTPFGSFNSSESERERVKNTITSWYSTRLLGSLHTALADMRDKFPNNGSQPNAFIVFCSEAREKDVQLAAKAAQDLIARGRLTFVALNDVDVERLKTLSPNIIKWNMTETDEPEDWHYEFDDAYNCDDPPTSDSSNSASENINNQVNVDIDINIASVPLPPCRSNDPGCAKLHNTERQQSNDDSRQSEDV
ncbi:hypothetical protein DdX_12360 [Ditylenchus destructor]|uniref:VWFA domain-containing protein n=1 Tax=Ditylenchus destructor TaxID=166010 RepID=A0AAD4MWG9_9BILA|nr:hypothetical protein DdX_12360 [Ditylenchus destructor]